MKAENGAYDLEGVIWHTHSNKLMVKILELWTDKNIPIIDLGCGHNFYSNVLSYAGYLSIGCDANSYDRFRTDIIQLDLTDSVFGRVYNDDCRKFIDLNLFDYLCRYNDSFKKSNVISLEVGEHIPSDKSDAYLNNLTSFGSDIIMSWAVEGQAGVGHVNCRNNDWVIEQVEKRGYKHVAEKTKELREAVNGCHCDWLKNTLLYFTPKH